MLWQDCVSVQARLSLPCSHMRYVLKYNHRALFFQWNLVCSRSNLAALAQSLVIAGQGIGAFVMSHLADRYGRKSVHVLSHIGVMLTMGVMTFSTSIYMLLALRLVAGTFQQVQMSRDM